MLNRVAPRQDGIVLSFSTQDVTAGFVSELVSFVDQCLQHWLGVHQDKFRLAGGRE